MLYILDEPSIGLHQRDNIKLLSTLKHLRDIGNTLLIVEHDQETMEESDWIVDIGPGAGHLGGQIVAQGTPEEIRNNPVSVTGKFLNGTEKIKGPKTRRTPKSRGGKWVTIQGARENNLKNIKNRYPNHILNKTKITGAFISFFIWTYQLFIFGVFLTR